MIDFTPQEWAKVLQAVMHKHGITDTIVTEEEILAMRAQHPDHSVLTIFEDHKIRVMTGPVRELQPIMDSFQNGGHKH